MKCELYVWRILYNSRRIGCMFFNMYVCIDNIYVIKVRIDKVSDYF